MSDTIESVESFRARAEAWLPGNLTLRDESSFRPTTDNAEQEWLEHREMQKKLYAGGFAGICFPTEYGGLGLTPAHQQAFSEAADAYEMPFNLNIPTLSIVAPTLLDCGSEEQKIARIGGALRGDEVLCQFLSEPSGGSDLAGLLTRAELDGDTWIINGSKIWSTHAYAADWALCLARTDPSVPKHRGLTMFLMPTKTPGLTMRRIRMVNGADEFCEEFFDDVRLPLSSVVGEVNGGWDVASRQLFHERTAVGGGSPYVSGRRPRMAERISPVALAEASGRTADVQIRSLVGEWIVAETVHHQLVERVGKAIRTGALLPPAASLTRLAQAEAYNAREDISVRIAGSAVAVGNGVDGGAGVRIGVSYLMRQGSNLGGGSTEMSRNIISERLLGMPREPAPNVHLPFDETKNSR